MSEDANANGAEPGDHSEGDRGRRPGDDPAERPAPGAGDTSGDPSGDTAGDPFAELTFDEKFVSDALVREDSAAERLAKGVPGPDRRAQRGRTRKPGQEASDEGVVVNLRSARSSSRSTTWLVDHRFVVVILATVVFMYLLAVLLAP